MGQKTITRTVSRSYEEGIPTTLEGFKDWQFSSGCTTGEDFKIFSRLFKKEIKRQIAGEMELVTFSRGHYDMFGFIKKNGKFVYFSANDTRHFPGSWYDQILIRTAKNEKDYTGGGNCYAPLKEFKANIDVLFELPS